MKLKQLNEMANSGETETGTWRVEGDKLIVTHFDVTDAKGRPEPYTLTAKELLAGEKDYRSGLEVEVSGSETSVIWGGEIEFVIPTSVYKAVTQGGYEDEDDTRRMRRR